MRLVLSLSALAASIAMVTGLSATLVFAHAEYESSSPARGEQLAVAPTQVEITFTQQIQKIAGSYDITVEKDRGPSVTAGPAVVNDDDRTKLSVPLQADLDDGRYVVNWKNLSDADGDPKEGAFSFYINYQPNAVDLENDSQLEGIGAEDDETPTADATSTTATSGPLATVSAPTSGATASSTATADATNNGSSNSSTLLIVGGIIAVVAIGVGGFILIRRRSA